MKVLRELSLSALIVTVLSACASEPETAERATPALAGTSWRIVEFQGGDDSELEPDDSDKFTVSFGVDGGVSVRLDCNRGRGTWTSPSPGQLQLGPLALTRAMCPDMKMHDHVAKHWEHIRSYVVRDGNLFLSLMADGGIYELEPVR